MGHPQSKIDSLVSRMDRLERQNRSLKLAIYGLTVCIVAGLLTAASQAPNRMIDAEEIVLRDGNGNVRMKIEVNNEEGVVQSFLDANGEARIKTLIQPDGVARLRFMDEAGQVRLGMYEYPPDHENFAGYTGIGFINTDGKEVINIQTKDWARQFFRDAEGYARNMFGVTTGGTVYQTLYDKNGQPRIKNEVYADGDATRQMYDSTGTLRIDMNVFARGLANFRMSDRSGELRLLSYANANGEAAHSLYDKEGKKRITTFADKDAGQLYYDRGGKTRIYSGTLFNGSVSQAIVDASGTARLSSAINNRNEFSFYVEKSAFEHAYDGLSAAMTFVTLWQLLSGEN